ncbi:MAG: hypothetical protein WA418_23080 [Bradyrhizobium sp.]
MSNPDQFKIACYMGWCGAEATFGFSGKAQYDAARASLDKIAKNHLRGGEVPQGFPRSVADYYVIEDQHRAAFDALMRHQAK